MLEDGLTDLLLQVRVSLDARWKNLLARQSISLLWSHVCHVHHLWWSTWHSLLSTWHSHTWSLSHSWGLWHGVWLWHLMLSLHIHVLLLVSSSVVVVLSWSS